MPTVDGARRDKEATLAWLRMSLTWELSLAVAVLGLVAILGMASPID